MLQLANPRYLSGLLHRLCGLYRLCLTISLGCLTISLGYLAISLGYLTISLPGLCGPAVTLRGLSGAWHNAWLCLRLRLRLRLGEVGV